MIQSFLIYAQPKTKTQTPHLCSLKIQIGYQIFAEDLGGSYELSFSLSFFILKGPKVATSPNNSGHKTKNILIVFSSQNTLRRRALVGAARAFVILGPVDHEVPGARNTWTIFCTKVEFVIKRRKTSKDLNRIQKDYCLHQKSFNQMKFLSNIESQFS